MFNKKFQRKAGIVIAILVSIAMLVTLIPAGFTGTPQDQNLASSSYNYDNLKAVVEALEKQVAQSPDNSGLRLDLANAYYDLGNLAREKAPEEVQGNFEKAVSHYEEVLKTKADDVNVLVDAATVAFFAGKDEIAENNFQKALGQDPNFFNGLLNYGVFLMSAKGDFKGAISQWQKALDNNPEGPNADYLKNLITQAQELELNAKLDEAAGTK